MLPANLETAVYGLIVTPVLHIADKSGMLSEILAAPSTAAEVSERIGAEGDSVERILLVLTAHNIIERSLDGRFSVDAAMIPYLDKTNPDYIGGFVTHMIEEAAGRIATLESNLFRAADGAISGSISAPYDHFYRDDAATEDFMAAMWSLSYGVSRELAVLAELNDSRLLVDVGGANGPFAAAALEVAPQLDAVIFDLPAIKPHVEKTRQTQGLGDRLQFVGGDFFNDELPTGDVVAFGYVMSNWPDEQCVELLTKAHKACTPGGKVLVMDRLFDDNKRGPMATAAMNLTMKVETYGVHRTVDEFRRLFEAAGFGHVEVVRSNRDKHLLIAPR